MAPRGRVVRALQPILSEPHICLSCRRNLNLPISSTISHHTTRSYATAAPTSTASTPSPPPPLTSSTAQQPPPSTTPVPAPTISPAKPPKPTYTLHAGLLLSRPPNLTPDLSPFLRAYYLYQRRLNERLALPFTRYFYFKKGTPADLEWKRKVKTRRTPARDIGVYNPYDKEGWQDEVLVGEGLGEDLDGETRRRLVGDLEDDGSGKGMLPGTGAAPALGGEGEKGALKGGEAQKTVGPVAPVKKRRGAEVEKPMSRITKADEEGDMKSLDRVGWRTLYLVVKLADGRWIFPSARLVGRENLRQGAERIHHSLGENTNTWIVGNAPVGHYNYSYSKGVRDEENNTMDLGEKHFFLKSRIMAGQADLSSKGKELGWQEFKWLTKEEVQQHTTRRYYAQVETMLADR